MTDFKTAVNFDGSPRNEDSPIDLTTPSSHTQDTQVNTEQIYEQLITLANKS